MKPGKAQFFASPEAFREWLSNNHATKSEITVGFWKVGTGKASVTWPQAIEEAIAFGWIDSVRHSIDESSYSNRFTPRRASSNWSLVNVKTAKRLIKEGRMSPAGLAAFKRRGSDKEAAYAYEEWKNPRLSRAEAGALRGDAKAWEWFRSRPPYYQRTATWWVISAKKSETRARRLEQLIECSRSGRTIPPLTPRRGKG